MLAAGKAIQRAGREGDPAKRSAGAGAYIACAQRRKIRAVRHAAKRRQGTGKPIVTLSIPATRGVGGVEGPVPLTPYPSAGRRPDPDAGQKTASRSPISRSAENSLSPLREIPAPSREREKIAPPAHSRAVPFRSRHQPAALRLPPWAAFAVSGSKKRDILRGKNFHRQIRILNILKLNDFLNLARELH